MHESSNNQDAPIIVGAPHYATLAGVLQAAHDHAALGKGHDRHGSDDVPFLNQPSMEIGRMVGTGYPIGQAMKKLQESSRFIERGDLGAAASELLGAINFAAMALLLLREL